MRINHIAIENYKAIERFEFEFKPVEFADELDIFVFGSKNGVGKTSLLECIGLSGLILYYQDDMAFVLSNPPVEVSTRFDVRGVIRAGARSSHLSTTWSSLESCEQVDVLIGGHRRELVSIENLTGFNRVMPAPVAINVFGCWSLFASVVGTSFEPMVLESFVFLNSYRKVSEQNYSPSQRSRTLVGQRASGVNALKNVVVQLLLSQSGLFEESPSELGDPTAALTQLNDLMERFAGGRIDKLRPLSDGSLELRVRPVDDPSASFSFDGLSSGQKEIISTLFLIWHATREAPGVVLIDEPELHLNAEWQRAFIQTLRLLNPRNQYIMATHSELIFNAVPEDRRFLLEV